MYAQCTFEIIIESAEHNIIFLVKYMGHKYFAVYFMFQFLKDPDITIPFAFLLGKIIPAKVSMCAICYV